MKTIKLENVTKVYRKRIILENINYEFLDNLLYLIIGDNGSGKSTLLKLILKLIYPTTGKIISNNTIGYVPERINVPSQIRVKDFLNCFMNLKKVTDYMYVYDLLDLWEMKECQNLKLKELSKGMLQKILIVFAMMDKPQVYVFDEPLSGLDIERQNYFIKVIDTLRKEKAMVLITSHYPYVYDHLVDKTLLIKDKKLYEL